MYRFLPLWFLFLLTLSVASGQNASLPQLKTRSAGPAKPTPNGTDRQVTLDVRVADRHGVPLRGLQKRDFTLLDSKRPLNILSFQAVDGSAKATTDTPVEIILVVDTVNTPFEAVSYERNEIRRFLLQNGGKLAQPVSLIIFSDTGTKIQNGSSRGGNELVAQYDQYESGVRSTTRSQAAYGAIELYQKSLNTIYSLAEYEETHSGRKLMIWISPGWPLLSGPEITLNDKDENHLFNSIVQASTELRQAGVTVYVVDPLGAADAVVGTTYEAFLKGVASAKRAQLGDLGLQVLAVQSGGRVLRTSNNLTAAISNCAGDVDTFYVLTFDAPPAKQPDEYHSLAVTVDKPEATARTRTGYYNQP